MLRISSPRLAFALIVLAGLLVFLPAVTSPFFLDDYLHAAMVEGVFPVPRSPFNLYDFVGDADRDVLVGRGLLPWWTAPDLKIRFFRPLASALLWADHHAFGSSALLPHLHSLAWWLLAVWAVHLLVRRRFDRRPTWFAAIVFALAPCHALPIAWLANRETLLSVTFGAFALHAYARIREGGSWRHLALAFVLFTFALLGGGEYALAFGGYVLAIALTRRGTAWTKRIVDMWPFAVPTIVYLAVRFELRYGTAGSGFYADPLRDPAAFLLIAPYRLAAQLADAWLSFGTLHWIETWERIAVGVIAIAGAALLVPVIKRTLAALEDAQREAATWLLWGSLLALAPTLAVVPAMRLLGAAMIGVAVASALVFDRVWFGPELEASLRGQLDSLAAITLGFSQLVHGPGSAFLFALQHKKDALEFQAHASWLRDRWRANPDAEINVLSALGPTFFYPFALDARGKPPEKFRVLSQAGHVLVQRTDERSIELTFAKDRAAYPLGERNLYRRAERPIPVGTVVRSPGFVVTVLEINEQGPRRVRFEFERPIGDTPWLIDGTKAKTPVEVSLPAIGFGAPFNP